MKRAWLWICLAACGAPATPVLTATSDAPGECVRYREPGISNIDGQPGAGCVPPRTFTARDSAIHYVQNGELEAAGNCFASAYRERTEAELALQAAQAYHAVGRHELARTFATQALDGSEDIATRARALLGELDSTH